MNRKRRHREQLSVSLFPFLAVLICTLGVLIVLLVLAVKSADTQVKSAHASNTQERESREALIEKQQQEIEHLNDLVDLRNTQIEGIQEVRPDALRRLEDARQRRAHIEADLRTSDQQARRLLEEYERLQTAETDSTSEPIDQSALGQLKKQIATAKEKRDAKRIESQKTPSKKYSIQPYRGRGGTLRRPIFVECTKDKLILQPHGIELAQTDFIPPIETGNMLDAALLTVRSYFQKYKLAKETEKPYPLLVVRSDGAATYGLARRAMTSWDDEFGYELVEANLPIDFGTPDPQLAEEIKKAIAESRRRQRAIAARRAMATANGSAGRGDRFGQTGSNQRPGFRVSGSRGGFVAENGQVGFANGSSNGTSNTGSRNAGYANQALDSNNTQQASFERSSNNSSNQSTSGRQANQNNQQSATAAANSFGDGSGSSKISSPNAAPAPKESLAARRGTNWALPTQTSGATGYVRPVRVICQHDRFIVQNATGKPTEILFQGDPVSTVDALVNETWNRIESWGIAGSNAYWKPDLRVTVRNGAEQSFQQFKALLDHSGLGLEQVTQ
jgi:biopolymer transport protein ExbD